MKRLFLGILLAAWMFSCNSGNKHTGEQISETRDLDGVSRLKINGVFSLVLSQSDQASLRIEGDKEMADKLQVKQNGDLLELSMEEGETSFFQNKSLTVHLAVADLEEFTFEGVGNIKTEEALTLDNILIRGKGVGNIKLDIEAESIDAEFNLLGNMELKGKATDVLLVNEGIGNVDASGLIAQTLSLKSSGIGRVSVHCEEDLSIEVNGIGAVEYSGNPKTVNEKVDGIGKVTRK
ncbi:hypothetical protein C943_03561 [Mariniradius saccharolyticus AK6]|uniref:DUF2807 domain-containing protein n=2 Tax=Mariniradius TaxID=1245590 RepID=A0ABS9BR12_9BACT|nr:MULTISPECIES: head GIN domain-containing protein [Mariniradius]EMS34342.1 hypothetical protein C943_03561 [Mariniradius saccharolyticus AK6]MCF1749586.1 DUF2807 domain-containing protein [Mariniradius sediminis]